MDFFLYEHLNKGSMLSIWATRVLSFATNMALSIFTISTKRIGSLLKLILSLYAFFIVRSIFSFLFTLTYHHINSRNFFVDQYFRNLIKISEWTSKNEKKLFSHFLRTSVPQIESICRPLFIEKKSHFDKLYHPLKLGRLNFGHLKKYMMYEEK